MSDNKRTRKGRTLKREWTGPRIRALRKHMGLTQREMADELQVRQQTISEWEQSLHTPHRSTQKVLSMIAERAQFVYDPRTTEAEQGDEADRGD